MPFKNENRFIYYIFGSYYEPHWLSKCMGILRFTNKEDNILSHWKNKRQWIFKWKTDNSRQVYCVLHLLLYIYIYLYSHLLFKGHLWPILDYFRSKWSGMCFYFLPFFSYRVFNMNKWGYGWSFSFYRWDYSELHYMYV